MTDKERLEDIKERFMKYEYDYNLSGEDVEWLIEQAERVQDLKIMLKVLEERNQRYKHALEFYADEEHYKEKLISEALCDADGVYISNDEYLPSIIYLDKGETARKALEGTKNEC